MTPLRLSFQHSSGVQQIVPAKLFDISEDGCGLDLEVELTPGTHVVVMGDLTNRGNGLEIQVRARVAWCRAASDWQFRAGLQFDMPINLGSAREGYKKKEVLDDDFADYYELLQLSPNADTDTVNRVYRIMAARYHPDNKDTGNAETFRKISEAHQVLADPQRRAGYDADHQTRKRLRWRIFDQPKSAQGVEAERAKRRGILSVLYTKRAHSPEQPGVSIVDLEEMLGVPREHLDFSLWFLRESGLAVRTDNGKFSITVKGVLESEEGDEWEQRAPESRMLEAPTPIRASR